jgi:hypothetical protein
VRQALLLLQKHFKKTSERDLCQNYNSLICFAFYLETWDGTGTDYSDIPRLILLADFHIEYFWSSKIPFKGHKNSTKKLKGLK